jgi:hypothetical protein
LGNLWVKDVFPVAKAQSNAASHESSGKQHKALSTTKGSGAIIGKNEKVRSYQ